jgi:hypothetical protein
VNGFQGMVSEQLGTSDQTKPQGLKPVFEANLVRGAEAPPFHGCARNYVFHRVLSFNWLCLPIRAFSRSDEDAAEVVLGVGSFRGGHAKIENLQGHSDGEDAVSESGKAFDVFSCNAVVEGVHRMGV